MTALFVVVWTNYSPPEVDSVWSTKVLAIAHAKKLWAESPGGVLSVFGEELDSGVFKFDKPVKTLRFERRIR